MLLTKLRNFKTNIKPTWIYAFVFSVIFGGVAHLYKMVNWLPNWDSLVFRKDPQHMESLGRWFLSFASKLSTDYEVPWLNGLLAIAFISVSAVLICETFDIKSKISAALIGAVTVTFQTVISTFTYTYVVDSYALSFLFVCIAVYLLTHKGKISAAAAVLLLTLSLGIYQAYITTAIALLTASLLTELLTSKDKAKTLTSLKKALKYIVCGIIAFLLYYVIQLAVTAFSNIEISNYQSLNETLAFKEISPLNAAKASLYIFYKFFIDFSNSINLYSVVNVAVFVVLVLGYALVIIKNVRGSALILAAVYIISIPFGCSALYFANVSIDYHTLMKMSFFIVYIYLILLFEKFEFKNRIINNLKAYSVILLCSAMVFSNVQTANIAYHKLQISFEKSYGILIRLSDRIESLPEFEKAEKILVVGQLKNSEDYSVIFPPEITGITDGLIVRKDDETVHQSVLTSALKDYCGVSLEFIEGKEAKELKNTEQVKNMPVWPKKDSVQIKDKTVIVKLSDD